MRNGWLTSDLGELKQHKWGLIELIKKNYAIVELPVLYYIYIYIYVYTCVCVCLCEYTYWDIMGSMEIYWDEMRMAAQVMHEVYHQR